MNGAILLFVLLATFGDARSQAPCLNGDCTVKEAEVVTTIGSFHNSWHDLNEREMFGTTCNSTIRGDFYKSKWRWQARFWCPSLSTIEGYSKNLDNRDDVIEGAIEDYRRKGKELGFLTEDQLQDSSDVESNSIFPSISLKSRHTRDVADNNAESSKEEKPVKVYANGVYKGDMVGDIRHGTGVYVWNSGEQYIGMWRYGYMHGIGIYRFADGSRYVGQFKANACEGYGIMTSASGYVYKGDFIDDKKFGYGEETWPDGDKYIGQFQNDKRHGLGYWILANGTKRAALYINGIEI